MLSIKNMCSPSSNKAVANQFLISDTDKNCTVYQSYKTVIAVALHDVKTIRVVNKYYSRTTNKYTRLFISQYKNYAVDYVNEGELCV